MKFTHADMRNLTDVFHQFQKKKDAIFNKPESYSAHYHTGYPDTTEATENNQCR